MNKSHTIRGEEISTQMLSNICHELKDRFMKSGHWKRFMPSIPLFEDQLNSLHNIHSAKTSAVLYYLIALAYKKHIDVKTLYIAASFVFGVDCPQKLLNQPVILGSFEGFKKIIATQSIDH